MNTIPTITKLITSIATCLPAPFSLSDFDSQGDEKYVEMHIAYKEIPNKNKAYMLFANIIIDEEATYATLKIVLGERSLDNKIYDQQGWQTNAVFTQRLDDPQIIPNAHKAIRETQVLFGTHKYCRQLLALLSAYYRASKAMKLDHTHNDHYTSASNAFKHMDAVA
jgi:hypothetical protein